MSNGAFFDQAKAENIHAMIDFTKRTAYTNRYPTG